ncbi:hypothetical protein SLOPH_2566 [Spraguea lophii 42_110]|uniref:ATP synthase subunit H n=1 Tax=Spraguea lophii (strain 42_110) TaxID=1358809 RepID=S7W7L5_SPRLO|nr:hypothetical protein SLOPH_2566 [Spraguea lophii 42_110]
MHFLLYILIAIITLILLITLSVYLIKKSKLEDKPVFIMAMIGALISAFIAWLVIFMAHVNPLLTPTKESEKGTETKEAEVKETGIKETNVQKEEIKQ